LAPALLIEITMLTTKACHHLGTYEQMLIFSI